MILLFFNLEISSQTEANSRNTGDSGIDPLGFSYGVGVSVPIMDLASLGVEDSVSLLIHILYSRAAVNADLLYTLGDSFAVGAESGFWLLYTPYSSSSDLDYYFLDMPFRALIRLGSGNTFLQGFAGYYLTLLSTVNGIDLPGAFSGMEVGLRGSLYGVYMEGSYILGAMDYFRINVGWGQTF